MAADPSESRPRAAPDSRDDGLGRRNESRQLKIGYWK